MLNKFAKLDINQQFYQVIDYYHKYGDVSQVYFFYNNLISDILILDINIFCFNIKNRFVCQKYKVIIVALY